VENQPQDQSLIFHRTYILAKFYSRNHLSTSRFVFELPIEIFLKRA